MKRISMTTIAAISAIFAACNSGNGENTSAEVNLASLAGTYSGYSLATCQMFTDMLATDQTLTVTDNGDGTLSISYTSDMFGEFSMPLLRERHWCCSRLVKGCFPEHTTSLRRRLTTDSSGLKPLWTAALSI